MTGGKHLLLGFSLLYRCSLGVTFGAFPLMSEDKTAGKSLVCCGLTTWATLAISFGMVMLPKLLLNFVITL